MEEPMPYPFKGTNLNAPEMLELERQIHKLVTDGKPQEALDLFRKHDLRSTLTPDVLAQMKAAVEAEEKLRLG
jgi:hypothetical protein